MPMQRGAGDLFNDLRKGTSKSAKDALYYGIRQIAQRCFDDLALIAEKVPEKRLKKIFTTDNVIPVMSAVGKVYHSCLHLPTPLFTPEERTHLTAALDLAGIDYDLNYLLRSSRYRTWLVEKLRRKEREIGKRFYFGPEFK